MKLKVNTTYVVADFDRTLTKETSVQSWGLLSESKVMNQNYINARNALYMHYRPIEVDTKISEKKRLKYIVEWFEKHLQLLIDEKLSENTLKKLAKRSDLIELREGAKEFLNFLHKNNIPLIIISAGLANIIECFLESQNLYYSNITIISNRIKFENGIATGINGKIIHSINKNEVIWTEEMQKTTKGRNKILLLGDSPHDIKMVNEKLRKNTFRVLLKTNERADDKEILKLFDFATDNFFDVLNLFN